jgi:hypothetical protein
LDILVYQENTKQIPYDSEKFFSKLGTQLEINQNKNLYNKRNKRQKIIQLMYRCLTTSTDQRVEIFLISIKYQDAKQFSK